MRKILEKFIFWAYPWALASRIRNTTPFRMLSSIISYTPAERIIMQAMDIACTLEKAGDYLEFGSYKGDSAVSAYHFSRHAGHKNLHIYCFDSFEGMPALADADIAAERFFKKGEFACNEKDFKRNLERRGVDMRYVTTIAGWYKNSLNAATKRLLPIQSASVVLIDCDLYTSTVLALDFITDYIQDGTIIIFDDWFLFHGNPAYGEPKAFTEWLIRNPHITATEYHKVGWSINSFILHKKLTSL